MKHLFIAKDAIYASKIGGGVISGIAEVTSLADGAIAFFTEAGALITVANVAAYTGTKTYLGVGTGAVATGAKLSIMIDRTVSYKQKSAYIAPVLQRSFVGNDGSTGALNFPGTLVPGSIAEILVVDTNVPVNNTIEAKKFRYQYVVRVGDTNAIIVTALIAKINADVDRIVSATVVGSQVGIQLDSLVTGGTFTVGTAEILADADIIYGGTSNSLAFKPGNGTPAQMLVMENELASHEGKTNAIWTPQLYYSVTSLVVAGKTYDIYDIKWNQDFKNAINSAVATTQHVIVAIPAGNVTAGQASFETIIATLFTPSSAL